MATLAIEVNDTALLAVRALAGGRAQILARSPGYAVADGSSLLVGKEASAAARLKPRFRTTRFWEALGTAPLPRPLPSRLSHADLAHAHLEDLWARAGRDVDRAVLLVPGWYSDEQLGLLLGIARACEIPVTDMVDGSLAAALHVETKESVHLDLHLHRAAAARVIRNDQVTRHDLGVETGVGLVALEDAWVTLIARLFVHQTRFDPLHRAESEQRLYDELPLLLDDLRTEAQTTVTMESSGKEHRVELLKEDVVSAALPYYRDIVGLAASLVSEGEAILLSHRLARLPGLGELVGRELSTEVKALGPETPAANIFRRLDRLSRSAPGGESLTFVTSLPAAVGETPAIRPPAAPPRAEARPRAPTHVLHHAVAYPIEPVPFLIGRDLPEGQRGLELSEDIPGVAAYHASLDRIDGRLVVEDHSREGCYVNGARVDDKSPLVPGDRLRLGTSEVELQLIEVRE